MEEYKLPILLPLILLSSTAQPKETTFKQRLSSFLFPFPRFFHPFCERRDRYQKVDLSSLLFGLSFLIQELFTLNILLFFERNKNKKEIKKKVLINLPSFQSQPGTVRFSIKRNQRQAHSKKHKRKKEFQAKMKFSAVIALSTLAITASSLPLELVYRSHHQARAAMPSMYARAAIPEPDAAPAPAPVAEVPPVPKLPLDINDPDTELDDSVYKRPQPRQRSTPRQRRAEIRAERAKASPSVYEREAQDAAPEVPEGVDDEDDEDDEEVVLDPASRAALLRRLIETEEQAAEKRAEEYIRSFRFHRRAVDMVSY